MQGAELAYIHSTSIQNRTMGVGGGVSLNPHNTENRFKMILSTTNMIQQKQPKPLKYTKTFNHFCYLIGSLQAETQANLTDYREMIYNPRYSEDDGLFCVSSQHFFFFCSLPQFRL